jgi:hypothetical protein
VTVALAARAAVAGASTRRTIRACVIDAGWAVVAGVADNSPPGTAPAKIQTTKWRDGQ